jgi:hypothetical protein
MVKRKDQAGTSGTGDPPDPGGGGPPDGKKAKKDKDPVRCRICGELGHSQYAHEILCDATVCDNEEHAAEEDHDEECFSRACGERGHWVHTHGLVCSTCNRRGHKTEDHGKVHSWSKNKVEACGFHGHLTKKNGDCPFRCPTEKAQQKAETAKLNEGIQQKKPQTAVVPMTFGTFLKDISLAPATESIIERTTQILVEASTLLNGFYLWCLEMHTPLPDLSDDETAKNFITRAFILVSRDENTRPPTNMRQSDDLSRLKQFHESWYTARLPPNHPWALRRNMAQVLREASDRYRVGMTNMIVVCLLGRIKKYAKWRLRWAVSQQFPAALGRPIDALAKDKHIDRIVGHWVNRLVENGPDAIYTLPPSFHDEIEASQAARIACSNAWLSLRLMLNGRSLVEDDIEKQWQEWFPVLHAINTEFRHHRQAFLADIASWVPRERSERIKVDPRRGKLLRPFSLLPHHSVKSKFVFFDTKALRQLYQEAAAMAGQSPPQLPESDTELWKRAVNVDLVTTQTRGFDSRFGTDGISCSVQVTRPWKKEWKATYELPSPEFLCGRKIAPMDEGRIDLYRGLVSDADADHLTLAAEETVIGCSRKEYYERAGFTEARKKRNRWKKQARRGPERIIDMETWTPVKTTSTLGEFGDYVEYQLRRLPKLLAFYHQRKWRRLRFHCFTTKRKLQSTLADEFIKRSGVQDPDQLIVVFGSAKFNHASKGGAATPRCGWLRKWLHERGCHIQGDLNEFKTSQRCSKCFAQLKGHVHWQVKRCPSCFTTWNRDLNASRNFRTIWLYMVRNGGQRPAPFAFSNAPLPPATLVQPDVEMGEAGGGGGQD